MKAAITVSGLVQGVCFRVATLEKARELALTGEVRNLSDGRVEILVEGPEKTVSKLAGWARTGPPGARVDGVEVVAGAGPGGYRGFRITG